jgi:hypothetical protein
MSAKLAWLYLMGQLQARVHYAAFDDVHGAMSPEQLLLLSSNGSGTAST